MSYEGPSAGGLPAALGWLREVVATLTGPALTTGALWLALAFPFEVTDATRFATSICLFGMVCTEISVPRRRRGRSQPRQFAIVAFACLTSALTWTSGAYGWRSLFLPMICGLLEPWRQARQASGLLVLLAWGAIVARSSDGYGAFGVLTTLIVLNLAVERFRGGATLWMRLVAIISGGQLLSMTLWLLAEEPDLRPPDLAWSEYPLPAPDGAGKLLLLSALLWSCIWVLKSPALSDGTRTPRLSPAHTPPPEARTAAHSARPTPPVRRGSPPLVPCRSPAPRCGPPSAPSGSGG